MRCCGGGERDPRTREGDKGWGGLMEGKRPTLEGVKPCPVEGWCVTG